jgi:hypothetical protein
VLTVPHAAEFIPSLKQVSLVRADARRPTEAYVAGNVVGDQATGKRSVFDRILRDSANRDPCASFASLRSWRGRRSDFFAEAVSFFCACLPRVTVLKSAPLA